MVKLLVFSFMVFLLSGCASNEYDVEELNSDIINELDNFEGFKSCFSHEENGIVFDVIFKKDIAFESHAKFAVLCSILESGISDLDSKRLIINYSIKDEWTREMALNRGDLARLKNLKQFHELPLFLFVINEVPNDVIALYNVLLSEVFYADVDEKIDFLQLVELCFSNDSKIRSNALLEIDLMLGMLEQKPAKYAVHIDYLKKIKNRINR